MHTLRKVALINAQMLQATLKKCVPSIPGYKFKEVGSLLDDLHPG